MPAAVRGQANSERFELGDVSLIGRGDAATIRLDDVSVSRQHATIRYENENFWLSDLGSANGTFVNGAAVTAARVLRNGDRLQFGTVFLIFEEDKSQVASQEAIDDRTQISRFAPSPTTMATTILVADLKGFTGICAKLTAAQVAELLREWYADCDAILKRHGASIDNFIGDCVFAYWHGTGPEIRRNALSAAEALREVENTPMSPMRALLKLEHGISMDCRIGIHLGPVALGSMGKGINTALGTAVNIAFRIEGLTRQIDRPILVSADFLAGWDEAGGLFEPCGAHAVKGQTELVEVFTPAAYRE